MIVFHIYSLCSIALVAMLVPIRSNKLVVVDGFVTGRTLRSERHGVHRDTLILANTEASTADDESSRNGVEEELENLQNILSSIEALEERNKAQLESFVDEEDQWESMESFERELLESKPKVIEQMEKLTEELMQLWMGAKSMEG